MKIISKHKDYYDYLVATFGFDDSRVYDRRNKELKPTLTYSCCDGRHLIAIAGVKHPVVIKKGKCYHKESKELDMYDNEFLKERGHATNLNEKYRTPVVIQAVGWRANYPHIPVLADYGFASIIPPEKMYMTIYNYLGWLKDNPEPPNNQTDKQKVVAHGFDLKKSFRPKIK